jgi:signal peptidase I
MLLQWYKTRGLRKQANHLLDMSSKVDSLRQDILPADDLAEQRKHHAALKALLKAKPFNEEAVTAAAQSLHDTMLRTGGKVYPVSFGTDWTEMFILAAIVAGGIRAFFITPMKIPTNSMWPTYHGMTAEVRSPNDPTPSIPERIWGKFTPVEHDDCTNNERVGRSVYPSTTHPQWLRTHSW